MTTLNKPKRPTSPARAAASRANGAKSRGPKTLRGQYDATLNGIRHDIHSRGLVLPGERQEQFDQLYHDLHEDLRPSTPMQRLLVEEIVASVWRKERVWGMETSHIARETTTGCIPGNLKPSERGAQAVANIVSRDRTLDLFLRCEARYERQIHRALARLIQLKTLPPDFDSQDPDQAPPAPLFVMPKHEGAHRPPLGPLCAVQSDEDPENQKVLCETPEPVENTPPAFSDNPRT